MSESLQRGIMLISQKRFDHAERELRGRWDKTRTTRWRTRSSRFAFRSARRSPKPAARRSGRSCSRPIFRSRITSWRASSAIKKISKGRKRRSTRRFDSIPRTPIISRSKASFDMIAAIGPEALDAAEKGLHVDSEHVGCANLRARALINLGRKAEANDTLDDALSKDPENAWTHANRGWALLEQSDRQRALEHFREALRLDPTLESARIGIVEALKSKHLIYRLMLRYFLWAAKLSKRAGIILIVCIFFGPQFLHGLGKQFPSFAGLFEAASLAIVAFAVMTWIAEPLFNLLLRVNKFGRMALSREQIVASNYLGICVLGAFSALPAWLATRNQALAFFLFLVFGFLMLPVSATFRTAPENLD